MPNARILVAYFSRAGLNYVNGAIVHLPVGNTEVAARLIAEATDGDLFRITPEKEYPEDYNECTATAQRELHAGSRPKITGGEANMAAYDTVLLGYPNWWGTMPMPVFTFLEANDFSGKTIAPFCTHEGSGLGRSTRDIALACPGSKVLKGLAIHGVAVWRSEADVRRWLNELGL